MNCSAQINKNGFNVRCALHCRQLINFTLEFFRSLVFNYLLESLKHLRFYFDSCRSKIMFTTIFGHIWQAVIPTLGIWTHMLNTNVNSYTQYIHRHIQHNIQQQQQENTELKFAEKVLWCARFSYYKLIFQIVYSYCFFKRWMIDKCFVS